MHRTRLTVALLLVALLLSVSRAQEAKKAGVEAMLNQDALPAGGSGAVAVVLDVPAGYHVQSHTPLEESLIATDVAPAPNAQVNWEAAVYPPPKIEEYPALGKISVYSGRVAIFVPVHVNDDAPPGALRLSGTVTYQMCDDKSCFAPEEAQWSVETKVVPAGTATTAQHADVFAAMSSATAATASTTGDSALWRFVAAFFIGMLFNVMPCVLPVVPLKIMGFYEVSQHHRLRSLALSLVFGLGVVIVFAALGVLVVIFRMNWGQLFSYTWFLSLIVGLLLAFALSMFNVFNVLLPTGVYRLSFRHDTWTGNLFWGAFTAVLSTPCTFGMFLGLLIWAVAQPAVVGLALLIVVGIGMAAPYIALSAFPEVARRFPRSGPWAELVKQMMGFLLLGSAVFFARRFIHGALGEKAFWWLLFVVALAAGVFLIVRAMQYSRRLVPRLVAAVIALAIVGPSLAFTLRQVNPPINWVPFSPEALEKARATGRPVMLEFTADWCTNCLALEATTFHDPRTIEAIKRMQVVTIRADLSRRDAPGWPAIRELSTVGAIPLTVIFPPHGEPIHLAGLYSTDELLAAIDKAHDSAPSASPSER